MTEPLVKGLIPKFNTIGELENKLVQHALSGPLSGYLAGDQYGTGYMVRELEEGWADTFKVRHAVAVNSATSGLLAAAAAVGLGPGTRFFAPALTMSATAAAPMVLGARPIFVDVGPETYCLDLVSRDSRDKVKAVIATNLFGHPAQLHSLKRWCDQNDAYLIEDAAQSPYATENGRYAGTIGHLGVYSMNIHKHLQCGEGGIVVTNSARLAGAVRNFRNHGECNDSTAVGLNLRMTELTAAVALAQLQKGPEIMKGRIELAHRLTKMVEGVPTIVPPFVRQDCTHSYYLWAIKVPKDRNRFVERMNAEGVPLIAGYVPPLYRLSAFSMYARKCPVAERLHDEQLAYFPVCAYSPTEEQLQQMDAAFKKVALQ